MFFGKEFRRNFIDTFYISLKNSFLLLFSVKKKKKRRKTYACKRFSIVKKKMYDGMRIALTEMDNIANLAHVTFRVTDLFMLIFY